MTNVRTIEVLSFEGCPNTDLAIRRAAEAARTTGFAGEVVSIVVRGAEDALARKFLGSPSVHVDGVDVDDGAPPGKGYGLHCRLYVHDGRVEGAPAVDRIVAALHAERQTQPGADAAAKTTAVDLSGIAAALAPAFPRGSEELLVPLVRLLARGAPVSRALLAKELGWPVERVTELLEQIPSIEYEAGEIIAAVLSTRETPHAFEVEGRQLYTWCALDALFLPALLGQSCRVASRCAATGAVVRLEVGPDAVLRTEPLGAAVSLVMDGCASELRRSFCDSVRFFVSEAAGREWLRARAGVILSVEDAFALGAAIARQLGWRSAAPASGAPAFTCTLPPPELRRRRFDEIARVRRAIARIEETPDGFVLGFPPSSELRAELEAFVRFEAACCSFITMTVADGTDGGIELRMTAPAAAIPLMRAEFIEVADERSSPPCACK